MREHLGRRLAAWSSPGVIAGLLLTAISATAAHGAVSMIMEPASPGSPDVVVRWASDAAGPFTILRRALLPDVFIVSRVELLPAGALPTPSAVPGLAVEVARAAGEKCLRCWNYRADVGSERGLPVLCGRCARVPAAAEASAAS